MARKKSYQRPGSQRGRRPSPPATPPPCAPPAPPWSDADDAFLRAIRNEPDCDAHRLVYADWLEEHGDLARAEFIRVQCEMAHLDCSSDRRTRYGKLSKRADALLGEHGSRWTFDLVRYINLQFHRGFVETLECDPRYFYSPEFSHLHSAVRRLLRCHPIRKLGWTYRYLTNENCRELARCEELALIRDLRCPYDPGRNDPESFGQLLTSPNLAGLEVLDLRRHSVDRADERFDERVMRVLATAPLLERLTRLDFGSNFISPEALTTLLESPQIGISELSLCGTFYPWHQSASDYQVTEAYTLPCVGPSGVLVLARSPAVARLRCLELVYNQLDVPAIEALLQSPYLDGVARLVLGEGENGGGLFGSRFQGTAFDAHKAALRTRFGTRLRIYPTD